MLIHSGDGRDDEYLWSYPTKVELTCHDGLSWWTFEDENTSTWKRTEDLIDHSKTRKAENNGAYKEINKFDTDLNNTYDIKIFKLPPKNGGFKQCRVTFIEYEGTALGAKVGVVVKDPKGLICRKKCSCPW